MLRFHSQVLEDRLAEIYHTGSTKIFLWELLHWFGKDRGRLTKAFFRDEIVSRWHEYFGDSAPPELSVLAVRADHGVTKPTAFIIFQKSFVFADNDDLIID